MNDPSERDAGNDDDGGLTRSVRQFRRIARLANRDPLRLLSPNPLIRLASLGAPLAALIEIAPFESLRAALATAEPERRSNGSRSRSQPLNTTGRPPRAYPAPPYGGIGSPANRSIDGVSTARIPVARQDDPEAWPERRDRASGATTLAERRAELRRGSRPRRDGLQPAVRLSARGLRPATNPAASRLGSSGGPVPVAQGGAGAAAIDAGHSPRSLRARGPGADPNAASPGAETDGIEVLAGAAAGAPLAAFASAPRFPVGLGTGNGVPPLLPEAGSPTVPSDAPAGSIAGLALRPRPVELPTGTTARPRYSSDRNAGLEITDDLFEVLYRNGVDLSWP